MRPIGLNRRLVRLCLGAHLCEGVAQGGALLLFEGLLALQVPYLGFECADAAALLLDDGLARVDEVEHGFLVHLGDVACRVGGLA